MIRPWMKRRPRESVVAWHRRLNRTCYACGHESATRLECDQHENACPTARNWRGH